MTSSVPYIKRYQHTLTFTAICKAYIFVHIQERYRPRVLHTLQRFASVLQLLPPSMPRTATRAPRHALRALP